MPKIARCPTSSFSGFILYFGTSWASKSAALLAAPGVLKPTAFMLALTDCFSFLRGGQSGPNSRVNLAVVSTSWLIFHYWPVFDLPWVCLSAFWSFFSRLGTLQPRFWSPSWPYVGTYFALGGIFRQGAGIAAKKPCWHFLSVFRFHNAARQYVRSTSAASRRECLACQTHFLLSFNACL